MKPYSTRPSFRGRPPSAIGPLTTEIATTREGRDITRPFVSGLQQPRDPRLLGAVDWGVYERIHQDDQVFSTFQQRRTAVVSRSWSVLPGDDADPRSVEAADRLGKTLDRIGWDRITDKMLFARFNGYAVAEIIWEARDGLIDFGRITVRHARRFRYNDAGELRLLTRNMSAGELLPDRKFWTLAMGGSDDDELYGRGLAEWLYWPTLFKRNGLRFWNTFLDKFGTPTAKGTYRPGTPRGDIEKLLGALQAIATDSGIVVPEGVAIELLQAARSGTADFAKMCEYMDGAIAKIVLSQTMTTDNGASLSQSQTHAGVKLEVIKSDADLQCGSFNEGPSRWWTDINYGPDVASPIVMRDCSEEEDAKAQADTDQILKGLGWVRTEESFQDTYGDGYERAAPSPEVKPGLPLAKPGAANNPAPEPGAEKDKKAVSFAADDLRPLYVFRPLLNADELIAWAKSQGFASLVPGSEMHVTITYSRRPVNWMKMGGYWSWTADNDRHTVPPGGPRLVEAIGSEGAVALFFFSGHLDQRNREMRDAGASWDYDAYLPHVTLTYDSGDLDLSTVEPYRGELRFGPETFEPLMDHWEQSIRETSFAQPPGPPPAPAIGKSIADAVATPDAGDMTDALVDQLITEAGYKAVKSLSQPILDAALAANSAEELKAALDALPGDERPLAATLENASFALTLDAEEGNTIDG